MGKKTDEEWRAADEAYAALPGTPPDGWTFIPMAEIEERTWDAYRDYMEPWRAEGMTHARWTRVTDGPGPPGVWLEVWKERPRKEAEFFPPLTASPVCVSSNPSDSASVGSTANPATGNGPNQPTAQHHASEGETE